MKLSRTLMKVSFFLMSFSSFFLSLNALSEDTMENKDRMHMQEISDRIAKQLWKLYDQTKIAGQ